MPIDPEFDRLFQDCTVNNNHESCAVLDVYVAITRIHSRLEEELKDLKIKIPNGPDPIPDGRIKDLFEGDPDGNPSRFLPTKSSVDASKRLNAAARLHDALVKIAGEFKEEISHMVTRSGKG